MTASQEKQLLRKGLIDKRLRLNEFQVEEYSKKTLNMLSNVVDWDKINKLHTYLPIKKYNEIDTGKLVAFLKQNYPNIQIVIAPNRSIKTVGIPTGNDYDLVIVPMLGFDRRGYRLGYGGGYYDKFLARNNCKQVIGLAYSFSEVEKLPDESHDQKMQLIITENEIIKI